jgi:hypothetical protein
LTANDQFGAPETALTHSLDHLRPRLILHIRRNRILKVQDNHIARQCAGLFQRAHIGSGADKERYDAGGFLSCPCFLRIGSEQ